MILAEPLQVFTEVHMRYVELLHAAARKNSAGFALPADIDLRDVPNVGTLRHDVSEQLYLGGFLSRVGTGPNYRAVETPPPALPEEFRERWEAMFR